MYQNVENKYREYKVLYRSDKEALSYVSINTLPSGESLKGSAATLSLSLVTVLTSPHKIILKPT